MPKHNQTKSLGSLTDLQSAPQPIPETTDERIDRLEHRLIQVETLLNDVTQQLDKPYRNQQHGNGKPKQAKLKQAKPPTTPPTLTAEQIKQAEQVKQEKQEKVIALEKAQQAAAAQRTARGFEKLQALLANSNRITAEELKAAGISTGKQGRIRKTKAFKESGIQYKKMPDKTYEYSLEPTK